jgi:hypothetical protein
MTVSLDNMIKLGPLRIMALSEREITANHSNGAIFAYGQKRPIAVLIRRGDALDVYGLQGDPMTREQVETICPGAWRAALDTD